MRALLLVFVAACSLNVDYDGTSYQCNPDGTCPPGYECLDMVCVASDPVPPACSTDITSGGGHSCAIREDRTVWCWGRNDFGQLGDGLAIDSDEPVQAIGITNAVQVQAGELHTCALDTMGTVRCWGQNSVGQLGDGSTSSDSRAPVVVRDLAGATQLSVGNEHACALKSDGTVACWGANADGQLGDGTMTPRSAPTSVPDLSGVTEVVAGYETTCAVTTAGTAYCWGENNDGELGVGDTAAHPRPTEVVGVTGATHVAVGNDFTCVLTAAGFVFCAGLNDEGQLGNGTFTNSSRPVTTLIPVGAVSLEAGSSHACARDEVNGAWCWGLAGDGRTLDASYGTHPIPVRGLVKDVEAISAGGEHTCVLDLTGAIRCAGFNRRGQLGDGRAITTGGPVAVSGVTNAVSVVAGARHACAVQADGQVLCWGENDDGEAGNGSFVGAQTVPHVVYGIAAPDLLVAGAQHTCARSSDGTLVCWGLNEDGRLGNGSTLSSAQPRPIANLATVTKLSAGDNASFAIVGNDARAWGTGFATTPQSIGPALDVSSGNAHVCILQPDRTVRCYGENYRNQLGDMSTTPRPEPGITVPMVANATGIHVRGESTCATLMDGTIKCWGLNGDGRLGIGNTNYMVGTASSVMGLSNVTKFAMGYDASCAIKADGTLWCWGANYFGQVGDGSYQTRSAPVQILGLNGVKDVASGGAHTCAIDSAGQVVCWGLGSNGQLGTGVRSIIRPVGVRMTCPS
jgi:alpha-tubulin suppressor-like RCC1 family protein